jgi:hypothetical protein
MSKLFGQAKKEPEPDVGNDSHIAAELKATAQRTAELAGMLHRRGWRVSVGIYADTSDKGPVATVCVTRTQTLVD